MPKVDEIPLRRRLARLGWPTLGLIGATVALLGLADLAGPVRLVRGGGGACPGARPANPTAPTS